MRDAAEGQGDAHKFMKTQMKAIRGEKEIEGFLPNINDDVLRMAEHPSGCSLSSARGIARLGAFMANRGTYDGNTLMSEATWEEFHSEPIVQCEVPFGQRSAFTKGGVSQFGLAGVVGTPTIEELYMPGISDRTENMLHSARPGWYGWAGLGGSVF